MDSDLWISRLMAAKRQFALQRAQRQHATPASHHDRFGYDDIEPEDEGRSDFPCPYCYEDHDITSLCTHLEDEHPFESKVVACPICSARISKDLLDHITLQHGYLFKLQRHHRLRRVAGTGNHTLSYTGRDLQETYLKVLLGNSGRSSNTNTSSSTTDSLLSSLVLNLSSSEAEDTSKSSAPAVVENSWFKRSLPSKNWKISAADSNLSHEEREQRRRRAADVSNISIKTAQTASTSQDVSDNSIKTTQNAPISQLEASGRTQFNVPSQQFIPHCSQRRITT